jgi:hypothetical protein
MKTTGREIVAQKNQCNVNGPKTKSYGQDLSVSRKDDGRKTENPHFTETLEQNNESGSAPQNWQLPAK